MNIRFYNLRYTLVALSLTTAVSAVSAQETADTASAASPRQAAPAVALHEVKGKVIDAATGQPAVGVQVGAYNNTLYAAMTDENGEYAIRIPDYVTSLTFRGDGYTMVQQPIGGLSTLPTVQMYSSKFAEIYSPKTLATSGKTTLVTYENNDISIDNQIQRNLGGDMLATMRGGQPGLGVQMLMNGLNSLNSNAQPLVIIDGVIQNMQYSSGSLHDGFFNNILTGIMVEDIEKISVMKNGAAIYGAKGANGVLLIETKRNKSMATKIDVSIGGSYELQPRLPQMMNAEQFRIYASELIGTTGTKNNSFKFLQTDPNYYYYNVYHNSTNWADKVYRNAFTQNYSINVQGGDDVANYNLSVGYAGSDATIKDFSFSRFNLRLNSDIVLTRNINIRFDAAYSDVTRNMRDDGVKDNVTDGVISAPGFLSLIKSPFLSPYAYDSSGHLSSYLAEEDDYLSDVYISQYGYNPSLANPISILENGEGNNKNYFGNRMVTLAVTPSWKINKDFTLADHFAFQLVNTDENYYQPVNGFPGYYIEGLGKVENKVSALAGRQITLMNDLYLAYSHRFGAHSLAAKGGFRYLRDTYRLNTQQAFNTGNDKTPTMNNASLFRETGGLDNRSTDLTYYLTADYNYMERYYLSAALAMDGSSKFGKDAADGVKIGNYAFGFFPSVEAAWVLTNENWFRPNRGVNHLKVNVGFDLLGNDDINSIASRTYFMANRMFQTTTGITMANIGNTRLQWETTARFTAGISGAFFQNRLYLSANYFNANTYNLLSLGTLSYVSGLETNWINGGRMHNEGFDVSADVKLLNTKDWKWSAGFSIGHYKNEIKSLATGAQSMKTDLYGATILTQVGSAAGLFYGYRTDGVFSTADEADAAALYQTTETGARQYFRAGDMKFVDVNGDHCINEKDMQVIGDPNPDIYGTISTNLSWKNLSLSASFGYSLGGDIYNYQRSILESGSYFYNQTTAMLSRWTHDGQTTDIPRASFFDAMGNSRFSDRWIEDGSFLKLKNVTLSYRIPVRSTYLQGITVWGAANNLFTLTKYLGSDPEFSQSNSVLGMGIDRGLLPIGRSFSLGVKINL
ncbi:MAG: SusC/RagA family TonB-linked outer membrane protein [Prevotellaceae bacterium]|nr:SusC/RagA family TonB-linked outer membrane protein [Prevotellaceae bacterium]